MDREAVVNLLGKQRVKKKSSMDQGSVEVSIEKKKEGLDRNEFVEKLSNQKKKEFLKGEKHTKMDATSKEKTHKDGCNKQATQPKI